MYLLKRYHKASGIPAQSTFTFHHVSIKTGLIKMAYAIEVKFTFHHVSIKTTHQTKTLLVGRDSHSTMYLLKRV